VSMLLTPCSDGDDIVSQYADVWFRVVQTRGDIVRLAIVLL